MADPVKLCTIEDIKENGAFGAYISINGIDKSFILTIDPDLSIPHKPVIRAYKNICPHIRTPLETFPNEFLDQSDSTILICSTHGARFQIKDGICISGPCIGQSLTPVSIKIRDNDIYLDQT